MPRHFPLISRRRSLATPEAILAFRLAEAGITARVIRAKTGITHRRANALVTARADVEAGVGKALAEAFRLAASELTRPLSNTEARDWAFYLRFSRNRSHAWRRIKQLLDLTGTRSDEAAPLIGVHRTQLSRGLAGTTRAPILGFEQVTRLFDDLEIIAAPALLLSTASLSAFIKPDRVEAYRVRQLAVRQQRSVHRRYVALMASGALPPLRVIAADVGIPQRRLRSYVTAKAPHRLKHLPTVTEIDRLKRYLRCLPTRVVTRRAHGKPKPSP